MSITRRQFLKTLAAFAGSAALGQVTSARPVAAAGDLPPRLWYGRRSQPYSALTFDDCTWLQPLRKLEQLLDANPGVKVTFFPVGQALLHTAVYNPDIWKRLVSQGHEIGYHGYNHRHSRAMSDMQCLADFERWLDACRQVLGTEPAVRFARPPYGETSDSFFNLCVRRNLVSVLWSAVWGASPQRRYMRNGDVVLLHVREEDIERTRLGLPLLSQSPPINAVTLSTLYDASYANDAAPDEGFQPAVITPPTTETPPPPATETTCPGAPPQRVRVGDRAFVSTRADRLSVRCEPQRLAKWIAYLEPGDCFTINGGPVCADDWSWWQITTETGVTGWVAEGGDSDDAYFINPLR